MQVTVLIIIAVNIASSLSENCNEVHRVRRQLLYPNSTVLQLNIGVGTPSPVKTVNVNWAIQANFQLPWNRTQIPVDILNSNAGYVGYSRKKREEKREGYTNDARLYHFYKFVEETMNGFGHNGSSCVLRALCQLGAEPLYSDGEDLLHEVASFVLNPLNDMNEDTPIEDSTYIQAYREGSGGGHCISLYNHCSISLIDLFSQLF